MILQMIQAAVIGITATIQISFYITAKKKPTLYLFAIVWSILSYFYITGSNSAVKFIYSLLFLAVPYLLFKNFFQEETYAKAYNMCIQAIVSVGLWYLSEHIFWGRPYLILLLNFAFNSVWCAIMGYFRKRAFAVVPYPEKNYQKAFFTCVILYFIMQLYLILEPNICQAPSNMTIPVFFGLVIGLVILNIMNKFLISNAEIVKTKKMMLIEANHKQMQHYIQDYQIYTEELRRFKHDQKHIVLGLQMALETNDIERAKNIVNQLSEKIDTSAITIYCTEDSFINAILTDAESRCKNANIQFFASVQIGESIRIRDTDLIAVLMNILNNAIENCTIPPHATEKYIKIRIFTAKNFLVIKCENTVHTEPEIQSGRIATTKSDKKHHGIGIESIRHIVRNYSGNVTLHCAQFLFKIEVIMDNITPPSSQE